MFLTRYDSNRIFNQLTHNALNNNYFKDFALSDRMNLNDTESREAQWVPQVDIQEQDKQYVILADIPGIDPKDIDITLHKGILTIAGNRDSGLITNQATEQGTPEEADQDDVNNDDQNRFKRVERFQGRFQRRFSIPDAVDQSRISAAGKNGVLELVIPKVAKSLPRKITVAA